MSYLNINKNILDEFNCLKFDNILLDTDANCIGLGSYLTSNINKNDLDLHDNIVVTNNSSVVSVFNVANRKIIQTFSMGKAFSLTCPALMLSDKCSLAAIFNNELIHRWNISEQVITLKRNKTELLKHACTLYEAMNNKICIVYCDGSLGFEDEVDKFYGSHDDTQFQDLNVKNSFKSFRNSNCSEIYVHVVSKASSKEFFIIYCLEQQQQGMDDKIIVSVSIEKEMIFDNLEQSRCLHKIIPINAEQYVICTQNSISRQEEISIYDMKFNITRSKFLSNVLLNGYIKQLHRIGSSLLLLTDKGIFEIELVYQESTLKTAMGIIKEDEDKTNSNIEKEIKYITECGDLAEFKERFNSLFEETTEEEGGRKKKNTLPSIMKEDSFKIISTVDSLVLKVIDKDWSVMEEINRLLNLNLISYRICEPLFKWLIDKREYYTLKLSLKRICDIPEKDIVSLLASLLGGGNEEENKPRNVIITNKAVTLPYTYSTMVSWLRHLNFEKTMLLIKHLETEMSELNLDLNVIIDWMSMLCDSHYTDILLSNEHDAFKNFKEQIENKCNETKLNLNLFFEQIKKRPRRKRYYIESFVY